MVRACLCWISAAPAWPGTPVPLGAEPAGSSPPQPQQEKWVVFRKASGLNLENSCQLHAEILERCLRSSWSAEKKSPAGKFHVTCILLFCLQSYVCVCDLINKWRSLDSGQPGVHCFTSQPQWEMRGLRAPWDCDYCSLLALSWGLPFPATPELP